jgi:hypothetical protein
VRPPLTRAFINEDRQKGEREEDKEQKEGGYPGAMSSGTCGNKARAQGADVMTEGKLGSAGQTERAPGRFRGRIPKIGTKKGAISIWR